MSEPPDEAHRDEVEAWRAGRYAALRRPMGWLTLAGLGWLKPGANRVGADPGADVVLPAGPADVGTISVEPGGVRATGAFGRDGRSVDDVPLESDRDGEPTILEVGPLRLCVIERGGRLAVRTWDTEAPALRTFRGIDHWPVDRAWRFRARFEPTPGRRVGVPDVIGVSDEQETPGNVVFATGGREHRLQALSGGADGQLWLIFGDLTNGRETYGGGRFLYTSPPDEHAGVIVDFNRAYNPPCVFSPYATCPLPWPANRLDIRVEAGERAFVPG